MHQIEFEIESQISGDELFPVDYQRLLQVLINLNSNAIKFSKPRSKIYITIARTFNCLVIKVRDFGIGISADNQARLFDPYFRVKDKISLKLNPNGNGLGLSICKKICSCLGGYINCISVPGEGTCMIFAMKIEDGEGLKPIKNTQILADFDLSPYDFSSDKKKDADSKLKSSPNEELSKERSTFEGESYQTK
jgi:signal transduction histidine kinase